MPKLSKKYLTHLRRELINDAWKKYKNLITMKDLAEIFRLDIAEAWRIIKGKYEESRDK